MVSQCLYVGFFVFVVGEEGVYGNVLRGVAGRDEVAAVFDYFLLVVESDVVSVKGVCTSALFIVCLAFFAPWR